MPSWEYFPVDVVVVVGLLVVAARIVVAAQVAMPCYSLLLLNNS
jgi:hypothetical protein